MILAAFLGASAYVKGRMDCSAIEEAQSLRAERDALKEQLASINLLLEAATGRAKEATAEAERKSEKVSEYERKLAEQPPIPRVCTLTRADVERLRTLAKGGGGS